MSAYVPLEAVLAGLFLERPPGALAVLYAYLDESGLHPGARTTIVGGLIGQFTDWMVVTALWRHRMDEDDIDTFHAVDCAGGHNEFFKYHDDERRRFLLWRDLANYIDANKFKPISGSLENAAYARVADAQFLERFPSAYSVAFEACLAQIDSYAEGQRTKAMVFFAIQQKYAKRSQYVAEAYELSQHH